MLAEKDEQITGLMAEGEKLSKQQLTYNTTIKKLRARLKETEDKLKKTEERATKAEEHESKLEIELKDVQVNFVNLLLWRNAEGVGWVDWSCDYSHHATVHSATLLASSTIFLINKKPVDNNI